MSDSLKIKNIEKYNEQIDNNSRKIIDNIKLFVLFGTLIFASMNDGLDTESEEFIIAGSVLFGTINLISLVKNICKNYQLKEKRDNLRNEYTKK